MEFSVNKKLSFLTFTFSLRLLQLQVREIDLNLIHLKSTICINYNTQGLR